MTVVALAGIVVNLAVLEILGRASRESLNVQAYLHIATDLAAFIGTAIAGALILVTGWDRFDPIASILVAGLMFAAAYELLKESGRIFLEAAPESALPADVGRAIVAHEGVAETHDSTSGRSRAASRRSPRTCSRTRAPTATGSGSSSNGCCTSGSGSTTRRFRSSTSGSRAALRSPPAARADR